MKYLIVCFAFCAAAALARPQEGAQFAREAIQSAQAQQILPRDATIENVSGDNQNLKLNLKLKLIFFKGSTINFCRNL